MSLRRGVSRTTDGDRGTRLDHAGGSDCSSGAVGMRQSELAYLQLRTEIVTLAVQPGDPLSESVTAARLGISRTPVREAIQKLAQENLVTMIPERGAFVAAFSRTDIIELFQLRLALEPVASRLAAKAPDVAVIENLLRETGRCPSLDRQWRGSRLSRSVLVDGHGADQHGGQRAAAERIAVDLAAVPADAGACRQQSRPAEQHRSGEQGDPGGGAGAGRPARRASSPGCI